MELSIYGWEVPVGEEKVPLFAEYLNLLRMPLNVNYGLTSAVFVRNEKGW